jgi:hypothetical protein
MSGPQPGRYAEAGCWLLPLADGGAAPVSSTRVDPVKGDCHG